MLGKALRRAFSIVALVVVASIFTVRSAQFTYAWTKNGAPFATTQSITDTPGLGDSTYAVTVTDSQGAVSNTAQTTVHVHDLTVAGTPTSEQILTTGSNTFNTTESLVAGSVTCRGCPRSGYLFRACRRGRRPDSVLEAEVREASRRR